MTEVYKRIKVDFSRRSNTHVIFARQNDFGARNMIIELTDNGTPYVIGKGVVATVNFKRPDGRLGAIGADILGESSLHANVAQVMICVCGTVTCSVSLYDNDGNVLTSSDFFIDVGDQHYSGDVIEDQPEYELLQSIFTRLSGYEVKEEERVEAEQKRAAAEAARVQAEAERKENEGENLGVMGSAVLSASKWTSGLTQYIRISGLGGDDLVTVFPSSRNDGEMLINYGIYVLPDVLNERIVVSALAAPAADISLRYFITRGKTDGGGIG